MDLSSEHKMKKKCKGEKVDRISSLPDKTIGHILSFLPTKHAVTTSVLSRRWQYLFTLVSNFDFDDSFTSHPRWNDYELADLQQQVSLRLCGDLMKLPASFQLPCLKVLHLFSVKFANEGCFSKLISGCPLLEDLALSFVWENVKVINISSTNLRRLTLNCSEGFSFKPSCRANIILDLPSLLYLEYEGYLASHFVMKNLKSIEEARIHIMSERDCSEFVSLSSFLELISGLCTANSIHLAGDSLEAVSCLPNFSNLTHLELDWYKWLNWRQVLPEILHSAPMLETLVFPWGLMKSESEDEYDSEQDFWSKPSNIPSCLSSSLKTVDIKFFNGFDEELRIVTYFLSHGKVLENLILHWRKISKQERRELKKLSKMRASKACLITVDEDRELYKGLQIDLSKFPNLKRTADS